MDGYFLGLDNGGTLIKACIFDSQGNHVATEKSRVPVLIPHSGYAERSFPDIWQANVDATRAVLQTAGLSSRDIKGIGVTGHGNGAYFLDANGTPTYNAILSADMRAKEYVRKWQSSGLAEEFFATTRQSVWAGQTTPIMAWFKDHEPEVYKKTKHVLLCKDYIRYRLTGEIATDESDISSISCLNLVSGAYAPEVFEGMGIGDGLEKMPRRILHATDFAGALTKEAANELGLQPGIPVCGGFFDVTSCALATGVTAPDQLCVVIGTWSINEFISDIPPQKSGLFNSSRYCLPGKYLLTEGSTTGASNLQWFVDHFMQAEAAEAMAKGQNIYHICDRMVEQCPYDDSGLLFLPFLYGTNAGLDAKAGFVGLSGRHTKAQMLRAIFEGIVFSHRQHIEVLTGQYGLKAKTVRLAGGGANSAPWVQLFADVLQLPVEASTAKELGAMGACMCAGVMTNVYESLEQSVDVFTRITNTVLPNKERADYYETKYRLYQQLIGILDPIWRPMDMLSSSK